jgi:hypothetical protein
MAVRRVAGDLRVPTLKGLNRRSEIARCLDASTGMLIFVLISSHIA